MFQWMRRKESVLWVPVFLLLFAVFFSGCTGDYAEEMEQYELEEEYPQDNGWEDPGGEEEPLF